MLDHVDQIGQKLLPDFVSLQNKPGMSLYNTLHFWMRFQIKGKVQKKLKKKNFKILVYVWLMYIYRRLFKSQLLYCYKLFYVARSKNHQAFTSKMVKNRKFWLFWNLAEKVWHTSSLPHLIRDSWTGCWTEEDAWFDKRNWNR